MSMIECPCYQCGQNPNNFERFQCVSCELYGSPDEFGDDKNGEICNDCFAFNLGDGPDEEELRDPGQAPDLDKDKL